MCLFPPLVCCLEMTTNRYLAGVEDFELKLFQHLYLLKNNTTKEARTAKKTRYLSLCAVALLSSLFALLRLMIQAMKSFSLSFIHNLDQSAPDVRTTPPKPHIDSGGISFQRCAGMEIIISSNSDSTATKVHQVEEGEICIATPSAQPVLPEGGAHLIRIPSSESTPPVAIVIRACAGQIKQSRLIFQSNKRMGVKVFRQFGMDEIPIKATENINPSTDRVLIGDVSVRFGTNLRRASCAP